MIKKSFRNIVIGAVLSIPIVSLSGQTAFAQGEDLYFSIVNDSSRSIVDFRVDPSSEQNWGPNILNRDVGPGVTLEVLIQDGLTTCVYDTYAQWSDGTEVIEEQVNMCDNPSWTYVD